MDILYDYQAFCMQRYGGVSNCFVQLIAHLPDVAHYKIALAESDNMHLADSQLTAFEPMRQPCDHFLRSRKFKGQRTLYDLYGKMWPSRTSEGRNRLLALDELKSGRYDVFHPTFFNDYFLPCLGKTPFVITVHDMISELFFSRFDLQVQKKRKVVERAAHVVAVSEKTKDDLVALFGVPEEKVTVIYHGAPGPLSGRRPEPLVDGKYLLYVGVRKAYKNFIPMLQALLPVLGRHQDIKLVCTGPDFTRQELAFFTQHGIADRVVHLRPTDAEMPALYAHALCFVFPSLYEGFGIPILEAYQAQCPVLLNHASCFPEIAQDAALFFHLDESGTDLPEVLEAFLAQTDDERRRLIGRQNRRLEEFSWEKSAQQLYQVYERVIAP